MAARLQSPRLASARRQVIRFFALLVVAGLVYNLIGQSHADQLTNRTLQLDNVLATANTSYTLAFTINSSDTLGSIGLELCANSPLQGDPCNPPNGSDMSAAVLTGQQGFADMNVKSTTANSVVVGHAPTPVNPPLSVAFTFGNITNPSANGSYYARISTYASSDGSGPVVDFGGLAFAITNNIQISSQVPPYLEFCSGVTISGLQCSGASGDFINFGSLSSSRTASGQSQFLAATNAANGYTVQLSGTTLTSGNNTIAAMPSQDVSRPGTPQFGMNLRANSDPPVGEDPAGPGQGQPTSVYDTPDRYRFVTSDIVATVLQPDDARKYTASYIVNIASSQPSGVYDSTVTYVCTGNF